MLTTFAGMRFNCLHHLFQVLFFHSVWNPFRYHFLLLIVMLIFSIIHCSLSEVHAVFTTSNFLYSFSERCIPVCFANYRKMCVLNVFWTCFECVLNVFWMLCVSGTYSWRHCNSFVFFSLCSKSWLIFRYQDWFSAIRIELFACRMLE